MAEQVFENVRKATESALQAQQEMFRKWTNYWTGLPSPQTPGIEQAQAFQKKWTEALTELLKTQRETLEAQFNVGLKTIEEACRVAQAKDPEQFRVKAVEFWQKSFESLRQLAESHLHDFQAAVAKWADLVTQKAP